MNKLFTKIASLSIGLALAIGVGVAVGSKQVNVVSAADQTYTLGTIPTNGWSTSGGSKTINSISWTYDSSSTVGCSDGSKIQVGSKKNPQTTPWHIKTAISNFGSGKVIKSITLSAYTTSLSASYDISVSGASVKSGSLTTSDSDYTILSLNASTGDVDFTLTGSSSSKAMYITGISITYGDSAAPSTYSVTYKSGEGTGSDYAVSNITSGTSHTLLNYNDNNLNYQAPQYQTFAGWSVVVGSAQAVTKSAGQSFSVTANSVCTALWSDNRTEVTLSASAEKNSLDIDETTTITVTSSVSGLAYTYSSSNTNVATVSGNVITGVAVGSATITVSYAGSSTYKPASTTVDITVYNSKAVEIDFVSKYGTTTTDIKDIDQIIDSNFGTKVVFSKNSGTDPKYYSGGVRCYGNNYFTVSSSMKKFSKITLTFGAGENSNEITTNVDTYDEPTWSAGSATNISSVTFSISGSSGNRRIKAISIEYLSTGPQIHITSTLTGLKYAGETGEITAEVVDSTEAVGTLQFTSEDEDVATIDLNDGSVTAVGKGETTITVSDSNGVAKSASFTLKVASSHKGDQLSDALTTEEAVEIYKLDSDHSTQYYVSGIIKEIDTESYSKTDYYIDGTSSEDAFDFYGPTAGPGIALETLTLDRQVTAFGAIEEWTDSNDNPLGTYGMSQPEIVYVNIGTLNSISITGSMTDTTYSSKDTAWDMAGLTVTAYYEGEDPIEITSAVSWSYNYSSPAAVDLDCEKGQSENISLSITASFNGKSASLASSATVTITNDGYYIHTSKGGWSKVTDVSNLAADDKVVIVAENYDYAMSTEQKTNNRGQAAVTKTDTKVSWEASSSVQELTLVAGTKSNTFAFYTGSGYLQACSSSSNNLHTVDEKDDNCSFLITISNGTASLVAQGTYTRNRLKYNNSSSIFSCYASGQSDVCLYKKGGVYEVGDDLINSVNSFETTYAWDAQCTTFNSENWTSGGSSFSASIKTNYELNDIVADINGNKVEAFLAKYDNVIRKFGISYDFLVRFSNGGINASSVIGNKTLQLNMKNTSTVIIIVVISSISVAALGGYFLFRKKKED